MSSKKPLNFAQALRAKAGEQKQAEVEPAPAVVEDFPAPPPVEAEKPISAEIIEPESRTSRHPQPDSQTPSLDVQPSGVLDVQPPTREDESRYPSRRNRTKVTARLPAQKVEKYKLWCHLNKVDLQDAIERGL